DDAPGSGPARAPAAVVVVQREAADQLVALAQIVEALGQRRAVDQDIADQVAYVGASRILGQRSLCVAARGEVRGAFRVGAVQRLLPDLLALVPALVVERGERLRRQAAARALGVARVAELIAHELELLGDRGVELALGEEALGRERERDEPD